MEEARRTGSTSLPAAALVVAIAGWASWISFTAITGMLTILSAALSIVALIAAWPGRRRGIAIVAAALSAGLVLFLALTLRYGCCSSSTTAPATRIRSATRITQLEKACSVDSHTIRQPIRS
jgi:polyferredoxin